MAERVERGSIGLIQRNREIAEVREEMLQMDQRLDAAQARNHVLLEETSVMDSTIFEHNGRAAGAEMQLAALFEQTKDREEELSRQRAARAKQASALQGEIASRSEKLQTTEAEAAAKKEAISALDGETQRLQSLLDVENATVAGVRRRRQEPFLGMAPRQDASEAEALRLVEEELGAIRRRRDEQQSDALATRRGIDDLEAELAAERGRRDEASATLRRAVVQQAEGTKKIQTAEANVAARGGDAKAVLAKLRGSDASADGTASVARAGAERATQLRSELQAAQEECKTRRGSLDLQRAQDSQAVEKLNSQLEQARTELQQNLKQAADAHSSEVAKLEQEVQAERQRATDEEVAQRVCMDQIAQLKAAQSRAHDERGCAIVRTQAEAGRCAALIEEFQRVQGEVRSAEGRLLAIQERIAQAEQRARDAAGDGAKRVLCVRGKIQALWQGINSVRVPASGAADRWPRGFH